MYSLKIVSLRLAEKGTHYIDEQGREFAMGADGYVSIGGIAHVLMGRQTQYAVQYLNGVGGHPNLGNNIRFHGDFTNEHAIAIHPSDVSDFVRRYWAYYAYTDHMVTDDQGERYPLTEGDREVLHNYLITEGVSQADLGR